LLTALFDSLVDRSANPATLQEVSRASAIRDDPAGLRVIVGPEYPFDMSADNLAEARKELEKEYAQVRESFGAIEQAVQSLMKAGPEDDLAKMLETLEDRVHKARTGGVLGSGANGHARALKDYLDVKVK
jgi:hypothetical protein